MHYPERLACSCGLSDPSLADRFSSFYLRKHLMSTKSRMYEHTFLSQLCKMLNLLILASKPMGETFPSMAYFGDLYFQNPYILIQLFRSACLHLYRRCFYPGGPIESQYLPHLRGGGDIFQVGVVWTLVIFQIC